MRALLWLTLLGFASFPVATLGAPMKAEGLYGWYRTSIFLNEDDELPFYMYLPQEGQGHFLNSSEKVLFDHQWTKGGVTITAHNSTRSQIKAAQTRPGILEGTWTRHTPMWGTVALELEAERVSTPDPKQRFQPASHCQSFAGHWAVQFSRLGRGAGTLQQDGCVVTGTFQPQHYGDDQHLAGIASGNKLLLSTFDGSNAAILYRLTLTPKGTIEGDLNTMSRWQETLTGQRSKSFHLPNNVHLKPGKKLTLPIFKRYLGKPTLVLLFATWCPSCMDEVTFLRDELYPKFKTRGLHIAAISYDLDKSEVENRKRAANFKRMMRISWPVETMQGGPDDFGEMRPLDKLQNWEALPTSIFLHRDGKVDYIHGGFTGPSLPSQHQQVKAQFMQAVKRITQ